MTPKAKRIGKLLIVDDCGRMRQEIRLTVDDLVEEIVEAGDGQAGIEAYQRHKPDWVTMDIAMSPVDGLTAAQKIKSLDPRARIVMVTAHDTEGFRQAASSAGAIGYVRKDDLERLRDTIERG